jgi:NAD(P)-dependent dehydrogenase (short-subunit alcohol dehydrogenase family)
LKRVADPLEIAQVILFLTGSESSFMTGAAIAVDGGRTFH